MSSNRDVSIGVRVDGAEQAKGEVREVRKEIEQLGAAGAGRGRSLNDALAGVSGYERAQRDLSQADNDQVTAKAKVAAATKKAAKSQDMFNDSARTAMTGILGQFSPTLAAVGTIAVDVAKGIGGVSKALVGMVGAGVAIGGIVMLFQHFADAARKVEEALRRMEEARKKQRDESLGAEGQVTEALAAAGVTPDAKTRQRVQDRVRAMGRREGAPAIPADYALSGLIAQMLGGLTSEQREQFIAGEVAAGTGPVTFGRDQAANQKAIADHLRLGGKDGAAEFAREYFAGRRQATRRDAAAMQGTDRSRQQQMIDTEVAGLGREHPQMTEEQLRDMRAYVMRRMGGDLTVREEQRAKSVEDELGGDWLRIITDDIIRNVTIGLGGGGYSSQPGAGGYWPGAARATGGMHGAGGGPVIVNYTVTNIDTSYGVLPGAASENRGVMAADLVGGTGVWN